MDYATIDLVLKILLWALCPVIIGLILLQGGAGDISSAFGGGGQLDSALGVGAGRKLAKVTGWLVVVLFISVTWLAIPKNKSIKYNAKPSAQQVPVDSKTVPPPAAGGQAAITIDPAKTDTATIKVEAPKAEPVKAVEPAKPDAAKPETATKVETKPTEAATVAAPAKVDAAPAQPVEAPKPAEAPKPVEAAKNPAPAPELKPDANAVAPTTEPPKKEAAPANPAGATPAK